jgi:hypothetical protein
MVRIRFFSANALACNEPMRCENNSVNAQALIEGLKRRDSQRPFWAIQVEFQGVTPHTTRSHRGRAASVTGRNS